MGFSKEPGFHPQPVQVIDQKTLQPTFPLYLTIEDKLAHLIPSRRACPHLSLNPLSGNSLY